MRTDRAHAYYLKPTYEDGFAATEKIFADALTTKKERTPVHPKDPMLKRSAVHCSANNATSRRHKYCLQNLHYIKQ